ncbi:LamB/YcsF family protein [Actinomadura sp. KC06]|uniref:5-oxoprolinase subunit PxpA n=1 Tax=Actinomadura sp. KC06 TaxID=2530369 RepID=UPI0010528990|nr:5-oxoprolinase subunit PxpA [Actinomadura sp. KC06]TDD34236.1 LamB/YcsF family protein [Actinomadura sp. KC06]
MSTGPALDVNCDLGESFGNWRMGSDEEIMPLVSTANVACGFHAGDPVTLLRTVRLAKEHGLSVGAHPGLPDLLGFGRRRIDLSPEDAYAYTVYQVGAVQAALAAEGMELHHVKPHGSFMSMVMYEEATAQAVMSAVKNTCRSPMVYVTAPVRDTELEAAAEAHGVRVVQEVYPDLEYADDGSVIVQRRKHETDIEKAQDQLKRVLNDGEVLTVTGKRLSVQAESVCVHGDGPNALEVAQALLDVVGESGRRVSAVRH